MYVDGDAVCVSGCRVQSGDWAPDEHARFLQALEMYGSGSSGQEWVLIAKHVGTRSEEATRYHAHAYFMMLQHKQQAGVPEAATTASSATPSAARPRSRLSELVSPTSVASKGSASPSNARASTPTPRSAKRKARRTSGSGGKKSPDGVGTSAGAGAGVGAGESATTPRNGTKSPKRRRRRKQVSLALQHIPSPSALSSPGSSLWGSPTVTLGLGAAAWTQEEDSIFENGLALYDEATIGRWDKVAAMIPHKSADDVRRRYDRPPARRAPVCSRGNVFGLVLMLTGVRTVTDTNSSCLMSPSSRQEPLCLFRT